MAHSTDLKSPPAAAGDDPDFTETVARVLAAVADHFTTARPGDRLEENALLINVQTQAYDICGRSIGSRAAHIARTAMAAAPEQPADITRGEYALRLRRVINRAPAGDLVGATGGAL
ncbi:hypothetical protein [Streptomyces sp. NPDC053560]|uniref:hypothetical protein n=1 Tax=Streptomyces sp. NPDC053560 TaxID=3365711 RepID=UPI0037D418DA